VGIYSFDLKSVFKAEGDVTIDGVTSPGSILEEANVFAPLLLIGLDFLFSFTSKWRMATRVGFVAGRYKDVSSVVVQVGINVQYYVSVTSV